MADLNRLAGILGNAKALMNKVENNDCSKGNVDASMISEGATGAVARVPSNTPQRIPKTTQERYPNLEKSGMPQAIKDAMVNNPMDIPEMPGFGGSFEATPELMEQVNGSRTPKTQSQPTNINEQQIRDIVRSEMESFMEEYFDKAVIKEEVQIKVGSTVFSGSLKPLPKKKRR